MDNINKNKQKYYVDSNKIKYKNKFVCWIDIMGTKNTMLESNEKAANFILRFHQCVLSVKGHFADMKFYPVMDGVYITAEKYDSMQCMLKELVLDLADMFCKETENRHRFVVRGAIAYGAVIDGSMIKKDICKMNDDYKQLMLLGLPVIQAYQSEREAPPFGLYIHESARMPKGFQGRYYAWFRNDSSDIVKKLCQSIDSYFEWCDAYRLYLQLDECKLYRYKEQVKEFFGCLQNVETSSK